MMRDCDTLLMVGSNFPYTQFLPDSDGDQAGVRAVQIDMDPADYRHALPHRGQSGR